MYFGMATKKILPYEEIINVRMASPATYSRRRCLAVDSKNKTFFFCHGQDKKVLSDVLAFMEASLKKIGPFGETIAADLNDQNKVQGLSGEKKRQGEFIIRSRSTFSEKSYRRMKCCSALAHLCITVIAALINPLLVLVVLVIVSIELIYSKKIVNLMTSNSRGETGRVLWNEQEITFIGQIFNNEIKETIPVRSINRIFVGSQEIESKIKCSVISITLGSEVKNFIPPC
jgi:hypothetical protein